MMKSGLVGDRELVFYRGLSECGQLVKSDQFGLRSKCTVPLSSLVDDSEP